jgi:hypothetical protein
MVVNPSKLAVLLGLLICGCQSDRTTAVPPKTTPISAGAPKSVNAAIRNNSLALLSDLMNDEKDLSKILIIKNASRELNQLVKDISNTAGTTAKRLKALAKQEGLRGENTALPPGEQATRKAIAKTKEHVLLHSKAAEFEVQLLLTQAEALNYGTHLASVIAENEPQPRRASEFTALSARLQQLYARTITLLRRPEMEQPKKP